MRIKLADLKQSSLHCRFVNKNTEAFLALVDSIKMYGFLGSILVRDIGGYYEVLDGLHRYDACKIVGITEIDCHVLEKMHDTTALSIQIVMNAHKIEMTTLEYSNHLKRIILRNPNITEAKLATLVAKSLQWVKNMLRLNGGIIANIAIAIILS